MQLTRAAAPHGRQVIQSYTTGQFRVGGALFMGSVLVLPEKALPWTVTAMEELTVGVFAAVLAEPAFDVCLLGCGARTQRLPKELRAKLKEAGLVVEPMDTGAAARTFNMLMGEGRRAAAALIAL